MINAFKEGIANNQTYSIDDGLAVINSYWQVPV
jgi:hypothetical protein